jgi:hypothetical protein
MGCCTLKERPAIAVLARQMPRYPLGGPKANMDRVGAANNRLRALSSIGIAVNNVINGGKNDLRQNGLAG